MEGALTRAQIAGGGPTWSAGGMVTLTGCLLITSVLLDYAGWPIPVVQTIAVAVAWPLLRVVERARLGASAT